MPGSVRGSRDPLSGDSGGPAQPEIRGDAGEHCHAHPVVVHEGTKAGIALATLYAPNGWIGALLTPLGIKVAYTPLGVVLALIFIGLPFVVRTLEPVMRDLSHDVEEAAASLGANRFDTILRVILPALGPAWLTGFALAFARGVGEYGSVIFIAGNMPYKSEIAPLLIVIELEQYDYAGAATVAMVMLGVSFLMLFVINAIQAWARRFS